MNQIRRLPAVEAAGAEVRMYKYERLFWMGLLYPTDCYFPTWVIEEDSSFHVLFIRFGSSIHNKRKDMVKRVIKNSKG